MELIDMEDRMGSSLRPAPQRPEELSDYITVARPRVWIVIAVLLAFLLALLAWSIWGQMYTSITCYGLSANGVIATFLTDDQVRYIKQMNCIVTIGDDENEGIISLIEGRPEVLEKQMKELNLGSYYDFIKERNDSLWVYYCEIIPEQKPDDGPVTIQFWAEARHPISYLIP